MSLNLNELLKKYLNQPAAANANSAKQDFDEVAAKIPRETLAQGVIESLRSNETPPFAQLVGQIYMQANPEERAAMINLLIPAFHPELWSSIADGALASLFQRNGGHATVTPEETSQLTLENVIDIAAGAERQTPGIVERMGEFYALHSELIKTLGGTAVAIALHRIARASNV